jgi:hypothetical protein
MRTALKLSITPALLALCLPQYAEAGLTITGTVTPSLNVPIVQPAIDPTDELLKIRLEASNDSILLCLGSFSDISSNPPKCGQPLGDPVGPGGRAGAQAIFLLNAKQLVGRYLYIFSYLGTPTATFTLTIE